MCLQAGLPGSVILGYANQSRGNGKRSPSVSTSSVVLSVALGSSPPEWPAHFPPGCPAEDTPDVNGPVFHLVRGAPEDWLSHLERGIESTNPEVTDCQRAALSCYLTIEDIREFREAIPRFRGRGIARADLEPRHGKIRETGNEGHHSLWLRAQYHQDCPSLFTMVPEE